VLFGSVGRRGNYGVDTPAVPAVQAFLALIMLQVGYKQITNDDNNEGWALIAAGGLLLAIALVYLHASRRGKFRVWSRALGELNLDGSEQAVDLNCARGAVTTLVAARLTTGKVLGVDTWSRKSMMTSNRAGSEDQIARRNAVAEGVADRVEYKQADIRDLNLPGNHYDLVVSGLGISALPRDDFRQEAIDEAVRVAKPGGQLLIADIRNIDKYVSRLRHLGCEVSTRPAGWEAWYGGPWLSTTLISATKPLD
jgi:arsenite methyltransferase